jgi:small-conductance mechanosensitive channel
VWATTCGSDSVEGYVVDVGWRSTRVRMLQDNVVVVPNKRVAESIITNYDLPQSRLGLQIRVSVGYESDPDQVEALLVDEATRAARDVPGLLDDPRPTARLIPGFGESSLDFTVACQVESFVVQYPVQHELRKRILRRLRAEVSRCRFRLGLSSFAGRASFSLSESRAPGAHAMRGRSRTAESTASATSMSTASPIHGPR